MKTINLQKFGFIRREDLDFRDDGTAFKGYEYAGLVFTYARARGYVYISGRPDYGFSLDGQTKIYPPYKHYSAIKGYSKLDALNGASADCITEDDIEQLKKDATAYLEAFRAGHENQQKRKGSLSESKIKKYLLWLEEEAISNGNEPYANDATVAANKEQARMSRMLIDLIEEGRFDD